ncbi:MAG: hypothetical protein JXP39_05215 [Spirochaetales bacterium]|nr:hypothetical protein [Spirochaetales bacterium]
MNKRKTTLDCARLETLSYTDMSRSVGLIALCFLLILPRMHADGSPSWREFGPSDGKALVVAWRADAGAETERIIDALSEELSRTVLASRVCLAPLASNSPTFRGDSREEIGYSLKSLAAISEAGPIQAVVYIEAGNDDNISAECGAGGLTSPRWLLEKVLALENPQVRLAETRMSLYRLKWVPGDPVLANLLNDGYSAILLRGGEGLASALKRLAADDSKQDMNGYDRHYLLFQRTNGLAVISEGVIVFAAITAAGFVLFSVFFLGFLFGKSRDQRLKDFRRFWWLPLVYLFVNILCLTAGRLAVQLLLSFRFAHSAAWTLLPQFALLAKLALALFLVDLIFSLNQLIRFPSDGFIYGYFASLACGVNIFLFSATDFSLTFYFLAFYLVVYIASHNSHPATSFAAAILLVAPVIPWARELLQNDWRTISPLFTGTDLWDVKIAFYLIPIQFLVSRLLHSAGRFGMKNKLYIPLNAVLMSIPALASAFMLLYVPAWSADRPVHVLIRQRIGKEGSNLTLEAPAVPEGLSPAMDPDARTSSLPEDPEALLPYTLANRRFLERNINTLAISPRIFAERLIIEVRSAEGVSVFSASENFILADAGKTARFGIDTPDGKGATIEFTSEAGVPLEISITALTTKNPWGIIVEHPAITSSYMLEVERIVIADAADQTGEAE